MACEVLFLEGGYLDGEPLLSATAADYVAGQPVKITSTGYDVALLPADVLGMFKNDKSQDAGPLVGPQVGDAPASGSISCTVIKGTVKVKMTTGTKKDLTTTTPFAFPPTGNAGVWAVGQKLFVSATGKWDNAAAAGGDPDFGVVELAPAAATDPLEATMHPLIAKG